MRRILGERVDPLLALRPKLCRAWPAFTVALAMLSYGTLQLHATRAYTPASAEMAEARCTLSTAFQALTSPVGDCRNCDRLASYIRTVNGVALSKTALYRRARPSNVEIHFRLGQTRKMKNILVYYDTEFATELEDIPIPNTALTRCSSRWSLLALTRKIGNTPSSSTSKSTKAMM